VENATELFENRRHCRNGRKYRRNSCYKKTDLKGRLKSRQGIWRNYMEGKVECIEFDCEKKYLSDFIHMTSELYSFKNTTHDSEELKHLLSGTHILSKYFVLRKFCILSG
jgi:hypothetical protein